MYCLKQVTSNNKERWIPHLRNCSEVPVAIKPKFQKRPSSEAFIETGSTFSEVHPTTSSSSADVQSWVDRVSCADIEVLDEMFSNIFYSTGIPFRVADREAVKAFLRRLRPGYSLPSAKRVAGGLIRKFHAKVLDNMFELVSNSKYIHLVSDGWSSLRNDHYVNFIAVFNSSIEMKPLLLQTINTKEEAQTAQNIAQDIGKVIAEVGPHKVASIVTDYAANMRERGRFYQKGILD
jgi:hypothetical protein